MHSNLFREQAVEHQTDRLHGEVLVLPSFSHSLITLVIAAWICAAVAWLVTSSYSRQETVSGWLEPPGGVVKIFSESSAGKVRQILVRDGDLVEEGQALIKINGDRTLATGTSLESILLQEYQQQQTLLNQQLERSEAIQAIQKTDIEHQVAALDEDHERLLRQVETIQKRQSLSDARVANYRAMNSNGHVSSAELDAMLEQQLSLRSERQSLEREKINRQNQRQQLSSRLSLLPQEYQNEISQIQSKLSDLAFNIAQLSGQRAHIIKAPRAGMVTNLQAKVGQQTNPGIPLMSIVPQGTNIEAKLLVPVRAAGFLEPGQNIEIRYDAFPYQKFGLYKGTVTAVSDSIILPDELNSVPLNIAEPAYLVYATLDSNQVNAYGKGFALKSGMTLSADIQLSERSLLEWILEPVLSLQGRI